LPTFTYLSANTTTTSTTGVDITSLTQAVVAGGVYQFEAQLLVGTSADTGGVSYGVALTAAGTATVGIIGTATVSAMVSGYLSAGAFSGNFLQAASINGTVTIKGIIRATASGNFSIKHRKNVSGTSTVYVDSYLRLIKIN
jgi:hypothetical protein